MIAATWRPERAAADPVVTYEFLECFLCFGSGLNTWTYHGIETTEACRCCNHGMITVERDS